MEFGKLGAEPDNHGIVLQVEHRVAKAEARIVRQRIGGVKGEKRT